MIKKYYLRDFFSTTCIQMQRKSPSILLRRPIGQIVTWSIVFILHLSLVSGGKMLPNPHFWQEMTKSIEEKKWKCDFPPNLLSETLNKDKLLYDNATEFLARRQFALSVKDYNAWASIMLQAFKELARNVSGRYVQQMKDAHILLALQDYVEHLHYFYVVADFMEARGFKVSPVGNLNSPIHDIDKLDPVMLVAYSEMFEDKKSTSLWNVAVHRHTTTNPHHQAHKLWHESICDGEPEITDLHQVALIEMVCDKVSRNLQKVYHGKMCKEIWDVDKRFFDGLPQFWLNKAYNMLHELKHNCC